MAEHIEILTKAIEKANNAGWRVFDEWRPMILQTWKPGGMVEIGVLYQDRTEPVKWVRELEGIIYNHEFAKALWGNAPLSDSEQLNVPAWQYHLQQMVISEDPIKYMEGTI